MEQLQQQLTENLAPAVRQQHLPQQLQQQLLSGMLLMQQDKGELCTLRLKEQELDQPLTTACAHQDMYVFVCARTWVRACRCQPLHAKTDPLHPMHY